MEGRREMCALDPDHMARSVRGMATAFLATRITRPPDTWEKKARGGREGGRRRATTVAELGVLGFVSTAGMSPKLGTGGEEEKSHIHAYGHAHPGKARVATDGAIYLPGHPSPICRRQSKGGTTVFVASESQIFSRLGQHPARVFEDLDDFNARQSKCSIEGCCVIFVGIATCHLQEAEAASWPPPRLPPPHSPLRPATGETLRIWMVHWVAMAMQTPSMPRGEHQSAALDLSAGGAGGSASSSKRDFVFVINPKGANGRTGKEWKKILPHLRARLGGLCNIYESFTSGPSHAMDITREAIKEGADAVITVGGDGTLHEAVNGFFESGKPLHARDHQPQHSTAIGLIPLGTGSDFARTFGWKNDPHEAIERIAKGMKSRIDVGVIHGENGEPHYFINVADIHLSAKAGFYASKYKRFGNLCYVFGALRGFMGHTNQDLRIKVDNGDGEIFEKVTALCIGNAKFFGGGMKITPMAHPTSGNLQVVILQNFKWYDFVFKLHKLYNGTHLSERNVCSRSVRTIEVEALERTNGIFVQSDGEYLGFLPRKFSIIPGAIEMLV
ncbi:hypothetical protein Taro_035607 [Colocasia esculenta]|uniref:DAGKc domain-containing protein n=1 Tax=Colocasia esculenta TaxID=4460 RepID=A0A843VUX4_COLES|nr:hypothetical protein [Colocasia esculenta]